MRPHDVHRGELRPSMPEVSQSLYLDPEKIGEKKIIIIMIIIVNTVERYPATLNKGQRITAVNDSLPRAQACIESDREAFEYTLKYFEKKLNHKKKLQIFFPQMSNIRQ